MPDNFPGFGIFRRGQLWVAAWGPLAFATSLTAALELYLPEDELREWHKQLKKVLSASDRPSSISMILKGQTLEWTWEGTKAMFHHLSRWVDELDRNTAS